MQVSPNHGSGPVSRTWLKAPSSAPGGTKADTVRFDGAAALDRALADTPDLRADRVERARELIRDVSYPPEETIQRIASLLATNLGKEPGDA